jgi:hypothetical protein
MKRELKRAGTKDFSHNLGLDMLILYIHMQSSTPIQKAFVVARNRQTVDNPYAVHPGDNSPQPGASGYIRGTMRSN